MVFSTKSLLLLVPKTGQGKSAVFYATALLNGGVNLIFYPLKSLAIDQENKTLDLSIQGASLVDYLDPTGLESLKLKLNKMSQQFCQESHEQEQVLSTTTTIENKKLDETAIVLLLTEHSFLLIQREIHQLNKVGGLKCVFIDEAHCLTGDGKTFRPELLQLGYKFLRRLAPTVKVVAATATCNNNILDDLTTLTNWKFDKVIWGSIDRREIYMRFELVTV
jgi:ATP-dependent DNA helicase RecQ